MYALDKQKDRKLLLASGSALLPSCVVSLDTEWDWLVFYWCVLNFRVDVCTSQVLHQQADDVARHKDNSVAFLVMIRIVIG